MFTSSHQPVLAILAESRSGLQWLLYGHITIPFWMVALVVGVAVTAGLVHFLRRLAD